MRAFGKHGLVKKRLKIAQQMIHEFLFLLSWIPNKEQ